MNIVWIVIVWLTPLWWGLALLVLAAFADRFPSWRRFAWRLFDRLEQTPKPFDQA